MAIDTGSGTIDRPAANGVANGKPLWPIAPAAFIRAKTDTGRDDDTIRIYRTALAHIVKAAGNPVDYDRLVRYARADVEHLAARDLAFRVLRRYDKWAANPRRGQPPAPWDLPEPAQLAARPVRVWAEDEWEAFRDVVKAASQPARGVFALMIDAALRPSELLALSRKVIVDAVKTEALTVIVQKTKSYGITPLSPWAIDAARGLLDVGGWQKISDLFGAKLGPSGQYKRLDRAFRAACTAAGMTEPGTPHEVRHNMAVMMLRQGATLEHVRRVLRHKKLDSLKHYTELSNRDVVNFKR